MPDTLEEKPSVLVVGAGAIGAFYGSVLARAGARVAAVCRGDYAAVRDHGFRVQSIKFGEYVFRPERVLRSAAEYGGAPDYVLLATKVLPGEDRAALIRPAVGPRTVIVLVQNGIDIEPEIAAAFPENEVLSAVAYAGVNRLEGGRLVHQSYGRIVFGRHPAGVTPAAERLGALFTAGGISCRVVEDVQRERWQKAVWNAVFNPLSIVGGVLDTGQILTEGAPEAFVRRALAEVCAVAAAHGHALPPSLVDQIVENTRAMPPYKTSMALDYANGRPMEIEAILGNVVRAGRRANVSIPALEAIYAIAKIIERSTASERT